METIIKKLEETETIDQTQRKLLKEQHRLLFNLDLIQTYSDRGRNSKLRNKKRYIWQNKVNFPHLNFFRIFKITKISKKEKDPKENFECKKAKSSNHQVNKMSGSNQNL